MDKTHETLELLKRVGPYMQNDPRYIFDQPEYYMGKELREFAKAKSKEFRAAESCEVQDATSNIQNTL